MQDLFRGQFAVLSSPQYPFLCQLYPSPPVPASLHPPPKGSGALTSRPTAPEYLFPEWLLSGASHPDCPLPRRHPLAPPDNNGSGVPGGGREARRKETGRGNRARSQETQTCSSSSSSYIARSRNHTSQKRFKFSVTQCSPPKVLTPRSKACLPLSAQPFWRARQGPPLQALLTGVLSRPAHDLSKEPGLTGTGFWGPQGVGAHEAPQGWGASRGTLHLQKHNPEAGGPRRSWAPPPIALRSWK